jgi:AmmeMemoRadiSam system protein B
LRCRETWDKIVAPVFNQRGKWNVQTKILCFIACVILAGTTNSSSQIPMENVRNRVAVPSQGDIRGLVDIVGFPRHAEQMDFIGKVCEDLERDAIRANQNRYGLADATAFVCGVSPHDDYMLAARVYAHVQRYMKARTVILIGNAHWSETFGIRGRLIFGDFKQWRGPYGLVKVSAAQDAIIAKLRAGSYTVNRELVETEHSLEAQIPYLQFYNRKVEIIPILIPFADWNTLDRLSSELAQAVTAIARQNNWRLGDDLAVLCSTDGQHYGDYGWSYYDYHPFGCDADGYMKAMAQDQKMINTFLVGQATTGGIRSLFTNLVDQDDISRYKVTWCGRFAVPFGVNFAVDLARMKENRDLRGLLLRVGSSLSDTWLPLKKFGLGATSDANLHHFVTYFSLGYK